jgi:hypothetical protein
MFRENTICPTFLRRFVRLVALTALLGLWASYANAQSPSGRWRGEWTSRSTGHSGPMRANIRPNGDGSYSARFSGRFFVVFPFTYRVDLQPTGWGNYSAEKKLGPLLGSYRMQTSIRGNSLTGSFQAAKDLGAVNMHRVGY